MPADFASATNLRANHPVGYICIGYMPNAQRTYNKFWISSQPQALLDFLGESCSQ
jgi:hypothetical protein